VRKVAIAVMAGCIGLVLSCAGPSVAQGLTFSPSCKGCGEKMENGLLMPVRSNATALDLKADPTVEELRDGARKALMSNSLDVARRLTRRWLLRCPEDEEANYTMAILYYLNDDYCNARPYIDKVFRSGGFNVPGALGMAIPMSEAWGDYGQVRTDALTVAAWGQRHKQRIVTIDAYLLASRTSLIYLRDGRAAGMYLEKAKKLLRPSDDEASKRIAGYEEDLRRMRTGLP
jgi:hypothetical protein